MSNMTAMLRDNTKIVVLPVDHFTGPRLTRRTFSARVALVDNCSVFEDCGHWGHLTVEAAIACGRKVKNRLPVSVVCRDSKVAGAFNADCDAPTTNSLRGKPLCEKHWKAALAERDRAAQSQRAYSAQVGRYNR